MESRNAINWESYSPEKINEIVQVALDRNVNFRTNKILGIPGTFLDDTIFYEDAIFLKESPFLRTLIANPNHIGCHTLENDSEPYFSGTQALEREVIEICAEQIFQAKKNECDGYISPGGTEANIQAIWVYRNLFIREYDACVEEIALVYSEDSHYSMPKGGNLLHLNSYSILVNEENREINLSNLEQQLEKAIKNGVKYFILIQNLATTMFGSIDTIDDVLEVFEQKQLIYKLHIDAAFGGFIVPFSKENFNISFKHPAISSITMDAHKMLQTPYGTGILLIRKGLLKYASTKEASYVKGGDVTLCGSRSGANAIALWMILRIQGSSKWIEHINNLLALTEQFCHQLEALKISYYRNPSVNIVTIPAHHVPLEVAIKFGLVPDTNNDNPRWWKIVIMKHVHGELLQEFINDLQKNVTSTSQQ